MKKCSFPLLLCLLIVACGASLRAEVKLPAIFGDHMVLQQGQKLPVWGTASPGEKITVSIGGKSAAAAADASGKWKIQLDPLPANSQPQELKVEGTNTLVFKDVLVGEVWLCSGQSNMEFPITSAHNSSQAIASAKVPGIRLFATGRTAAMSPQETCPGKWVLCSPQNITAVGAGGFSAVGYFFGKELHETRKVPVGLIESAYGGTPAQSWTRLEVLEADPALNHHAEAFKKNLAALPEQRAIFEQETLPKWKQEYAAWEQEHGAASKALLDQWKREAQDAAASGNPPPPKPRYPVPSPRPPFPPDKYPRQPVVLYNALIAPLIPYAIKGAIWYQGEANGSNQTTAKDYLTLLPAMFNDWRQSWQQGDFPFLMVQLAGYGQGTGFPYLRQAQMQMLSLPKVGMAVALDVGEEKEIHPKNKLVVGHRLFLAAQKIAYGENLTYSGPIYDSMTKEGRKIRLTFNHPGGGLVIGSAPAIRMGVEPAPPLDHLEGFAIAGSDKQFVPAEAVIEGTSTVVVWSDKVADPEHVRYGWGAFPKTNLYNKEGLPASPFATDFHF